MLAQKTHTSMLQNAFNLIWFSILDIRYLNLMQIHIEMTVIDVAHNILKVELEIRFVAKLR